MDAHQADYNTLTGMLSPALFMTATGSLLISANNRLARIVDRLRSLIAESEKLARGGDGADRPQETLVHIGGLIRLQKRRGDLVLITVTMLYAAFGTFVASSLALAINYRFNHPLPAVPTLLAVLGVSLLLCACVTMFREARLGILSLNRDVEFHVGPQPASEGINGRSGAA